MFNIKFAIRILVYLQSTAGLTRSVNPSLKTVGFASMVLEATAGYEPLRFTFCRPSQIYVPGWGQSAGFFSILRLKSDIYSWIQWKWQIISSLLGCYDGYNFAIFRDPTTTTTPFLSQNVSSGVAHRPSDVWGFAVIQMWKIEELKLLWVDLVHEINSITFLDDFCV